MVEEQYVDSELLIEVPEYETLEEYEAAEGPQDAPGPTEPEEDENDGSENE